MILCYHIIASIDMESVWRIYQFRSHLGPAYLSKYYLPSIEFHRIVNRELSSMHPISKNHSANNLRVMQQKHANFNYIDIQSHFSWNSELHTSSQTKRSVLCLTLRSSFSWAFCFFHSSFLFSSGRWQTAVDHKTVGNLNRMQITIRGKAVCVFRGGNNWVRAVAAMGGDVQSSPPPNVISLVCTQVVWGIRQRSAFRPLLRAWICNEMVGWAMAASNLLTAEWLYECSWFIYKISCPQPSKFSHHQYLLWSVNGCRHHRQCGETYNAKRKYINNTFWIFMYMHLVE